MTIATNGTFWERFRESIKFSEDSRIRVTKLAAEIREAAGYDLTRNSKFNKIPLRSTQIDAVADGRVASDARIRTAIADEQWGARLATIYGLGALIAEQHRTNELQYDIMKLQRETNTLLRELIAKLTTS